MKTEAKTVTPFEVKAVREEERTFEGLASTWEIDLGNDRIFPGAFQRTLTDWRQSKRTLPLIDQHDYGSVIRTRLGKLLEAEERPEGLWTKWKIFETNAGNDLLALLREKGVDGLSIGYRVRGEPEYQNGIRMLRDLELIEVSVVHWGMNPGALIDQGSVKSVIDRLSVELSGLEAKHVDRAQRVELRRIASRIGAILRTPDPDDVKGAMSDTEQARLADRIANVRAKVSSADSPQWRGLKSRLNTIRERELVTRIRTGMRYR